MGKTKIGRAMRAVALDRDASALMGVDINRVITITNSTPLPETGGPGIAWFALAGAAVAAAGLWLGNRRRRPARPVGSHFSG